MSCEKSPVLDHVDELVLKQGRSVRVVWLDVARVLACFLIIANHVAFYTGEIYRIIWAQFLAGRTSFFMIAAGYFVGIQYLRKCQGNLPWFIWRRSYFLLKPYLFWSLISLMTIGWSQYNENYLQYADFYRYIENINSEEWYDAMWALFKSFGVAGHPCDAPMWFLRDIIVYTVFAPILARLGRLLLPTGVLLLLLMSCISEITQHSYPSLASLGFFVIGLWLSRFSLHELTLKIEPYAWLWTILTLALTPYIIIYREAYQIWMLPLGVMGIMSTSILITRFFPNIASKIASWAPACFFVFATHYIVIIFIRESGLIPYKGWLWDLIWLGLIPVIYAFLAFIFFKLCRYVPKSIPWIGAYRVK